MWIVIAEITVCLLVALVFGLIMGWNLATDKKEKDLVIISDKLLASERELSELKKELANCKMTLLNEHNIVRK